MHPFTMSLIRSYERNFLRAFQRNKTSETTHNHAITLCYEALLADVELRADLFQKLAFSFNVWKVEWEHASRGLAKAYKPSASARDFGLYIVSTAKVFEYDEMAEDDDSCGIWIYCARIPVVSWTFTAPSPRSTTFFSGPRTS